MRSPHVNVAAIQPTIFQHRYWCRWRRLLHQEHVGREVATRRKRICSEVAYSEPYYRQICRPWDGRTDTGSPCMFTLGTAVLAHLVNVEPETWPLVHPLVSLVPDTFQDPGQDDTELTDGVADVNDRATALVSRVLRAKSEDSPGGVECTQEEAEDLIPAAEALVAASTSRLRHLRRIARGTSAQEAA